MTLSKPTVISADLEVKQELRSLGLTREVVQVVARAAAGAKVDTLPVDPCNAPGTFAYHFGVRHTRLQLLPLGGWRMGRNGNIEATINDTIGIQLWFQNVDQACREREPQAIWDKGSGARDLVQRGLQRDLFERPKDSSPVPLGASLTVWIICVSTEGKRLCAEVSCPENFEGDQFEKFSRRIFVVDESLDSKPEPKKNQDDGASDYEVKIARK